LDKVPTESGWEALGRKLARHRVALAAVAVLGVGFAVYKSGGVTTPDRWSGWVYPYGVSSPSHTWRSGGPFETFDRCRAWAHGELQRLFPDGIPSDADYECGKNCKPSDLGGLNVCEETRD
jgi:hypothetical protein